MPLADKDDGRPSCPYCGKLEGVQKDRLDKQSGPTYLCTLCEKRFGPGTAAWLEVGAANIDLTHGKDTKQAKPPELLVDMRFVWKSSEPPPEGDTAERATLRTLKQTNPKEFLARMADLEKNLLNHRVALKQSRMRHKIAEAQNKKEEIEDQSSVAVEGRLTALLADCRGETAP